MDHSRTVAGEIALGDLAKLEIGWQEWARTTRAAAGQPYPAPLAHAHSLAAVGRRAHAPLVLSIRFLKNRP